MLFSGRRIRKVCGFAVSVLLVLGISPSWAAGPAAPDSGQALRDIQHTPLLIPQPQPSDIAAPPDAAPGPAGRQGLKVFVRHFHFSGQVPADQTGLESLLANRLNQEWTFAELQQAADAVTQYCRDRGYFMARAYLPVQEIVAGAVEITVLIGKYGRITLRNDAGLNEALVRHELGDVRPGAYIEKKSLERAILILNALSGSETKATLTAGTESGTSDLVLEIMPKGKKINTVLTIDNGGNRFTGSNRTSLSVDIADPASRGDLFSLRGSYTGKGLAAGSAAWQVPFAVPGGKLGISYSKVDYQLGEEYAVLGLHGIAESSRVSWTYPLLRSRNHNLYGSIGYEAKNLRDITDSTGGNVRRKAHVVSYSLAGDSSDRWSGGGVNSYSLTVSQGHLDIRDADALANDSGTARTQGGYVKAEVSAVRQQYIHERLILLLNLDGQLANKNLDSSEKLSLGGAAAVRAFSPGEAPGDEGYVLSGELRWTIPTASRNGSTLQLAGFFDTGSVWINKGPWVSGANKRTLSGMGFGLLWGRPGAAMVKLNYAWKLGGDRAESDSDKNGRWWFSASRVF